jgi:hypothetical protein
MAWSRIVLTGLALVTGSAVAGPASSGAVPSQVRTTAGLVRPGSSGPAAPSSVPRYGGYDWSASPTGYYVYNGTGGGASSTYQGPALGSYVLFPGLQTMRDRVVLITTYETMDTCRINGWGPDNVAHVLHVNVWCGYNLHSATNGEFNVLVTKPSSRTHGVFDFAEVDSGRPPRFFRQNFHNSSGRPVRLRRLGIGRYQLTFLGPATRGTSGIVQVSAWVFRNCELAAWHGSPIGEVVNVDCYTFSGKPTDSRAVFYATYVRRTNLLGLNGMATANAFANRPHAAAPYQPADQYDSAQGARITVTRVSTGYYQVSLAGSGGPYQVNGGDVQVSAVSKVDNHCESYSWSKGPNPVANVYCTNNGGSATDSAFTIAWVVA